ncbi:MAG: glycosyltransferase [Bacteroides stercoris]
MLENISNGKLIEKFSLSSIEENEYKNFKGLKLLSIGRLMDQKNYPLAIQAASELRKKGIVFLWYVIGEGFDRAKLEALIEKENLGKVFKLIGLRENPYQYMRVADMIVMTSKFEGRSIALD